VAWNQLTLQIEATGLEQAEALLRLAGAVSVAISDHGDHPILEPEPGTTPLWPRLTVRALFAGPLDRDRVAALLGPLAAAGIAVETLHATTLEQARQQRIRPLRIGPRLAIVPAEEFDRADATALGLHMGLGFGTGQHPTTQLCLQWLEHQSVAGQSVLDFGCGSGVLALAALKLGARTATAIDNEPQALDATRRNAELNRLQSRLVIGPPAELEPGPFDLILANVLADPLIALAEDFARRQSPGGRIVLSGILDAQCAAVEQQYRHWYEPLVTARLADWALLSGVRRKYDS
jgi:ribosomal protein L11 methyltransferase